MVWFLAILFTIPAFWFIQIYWDRRSLDSVEFNRHFDRKAIFCGESVKMTISLANFKLLPLPWIRITSDIPERFKIEGQKIYESTEKLDNEYAIITSLRSYEKLTRIHEIKVDQRGYYAMFDVQLAAGDYYGFLKTVKHIHLPINLIVYPTIKPVEHLLLSPVRPNGKWRVKRWILPDVMDVMGSREYTYSEAFSDIDWLATAKVGELQVKQYDFNAKKTAMIFLDIRTHTKDWKFKDYELIEKGIEIAAGLTEICYQEKVDFGFATNSKLLGGETRSIIVPSGGLKQKMRVLEMLAKMSYYKKQDFGEFIQFNDQRMKKEDIIIYIGAFLNDDTKSHLNRLIAKGYACKIIFLKEQGQSDFIGLRKEIEIVYMNRGETDA